MDYAIKKGVSLSTLRRYIKANKIEYRVEKGRYMLPDEAELPPSLAMGGIGAIGFIHSKPAAPSLREAPQPPARTLQLERDLQRAREEIADLKTLIALYEEKMA